MTALLEETELRTMSLTRFAEELAAATPAPGGSTAAAVPSALAAGLVATAARLSARSDPFSELAYDMEAVAGEADRLRAELLDLVDEDAEAFDRVMEARRLTGRTPEQRAARSREVQRAYKAAVEPPLRVCELSLRVLELAGEVLERGNPNTASDAGVAALFAAASLEAAALNAEIELGPVDDEGFRSVRLRDVQAARLRVAPLRETALAAVHTGRPAL
jgi:formiminotetrahydrofolate cyclodeaminase